MQAFRRGNSITSAQAEKCIMDAAHDRRQQKVNIVFMNVQDRRQNTVNKKHYDYQLLFMVLVQICVYIITTLPFIL